MPTLLAGDIGGTKTILRLVKTAPSSDARPKTTLHEQTYPSQDFSDLVPMVQQFYRDASLASDSQPTAACFGIAGPVVGNTSELTNLSWSLMTERLEQDLQIPAVELINDFAAIGYGVLELSDQQIQTLQSAESQPDAPIAVLGAGTGLGQCFLIPDSQDYRVFASEGGHSDFAPRTELEFELLKYLRSQKQLQRISVERVVSGQGIVSIYQMLRNRGTDPESPELKELFEIWEQEQPEKTVDPAAAIAQAAMQQNDALCEQTLQMFVQAYGAEAGNLALKLLPYGGLYIAGGIAAKILPLLQRGDFMEAYARKGRMQPLLEKVPIHVVLEPKVGLMGAARQAARHS